MVRSSAFDASFCMKSEISILVDIQYDNRMGKTVLGGPENPWKSLSPSHRP